MKLLIIGIVGSGKTTLARELSQRIGVSHYELDSVVYDETGAKRYKRTPDEQVDEILRINAVGDWIFEGVYRKSYHIVLDIAEQILFLDPPIFVRKKRIFIRYIKQKLGIEKCGYKPSIKMLRLMYKWTDEFERDRAQFTNMLSGYSDKLISIKDIY